MPQRWLEGNVTPEMNVAFIPFGLGPRQCIARNLAMSELSIALRLLVESGVLEGLEVVGGVRVLGSSQRRIAILEWFNSKVIGEKVELSVR
jgi:cytochrome P450